MFKSYICKQSRKPIPMWLFMLMLVLWVTDSKANPDWTQDWTGKLNITPEMSLTLILHIKQKDGNYLATLDSVEQGAMGIAASHTNIKNQHFLFRFSSIGAQFKGEYQGGELVGTFSQGGGKLPLSLTPLTPELKQQVAEANARPQEPQAPYPYIEEEVSYTHVKQNFSFAGTLTKPKGNSPFAAAILVSGSGPQDRDSNLMNHKPFKVIADHLTRLGYAVLRTDDRGTGKSGGKFDNATINDFSFDVESAFNYLSQRKDIEASKIGLIGHSEGGMTAPIFAARQPKVAYIIMLAGLGVSGTELWATQQKELGLASGMTDGAAIYNLQYKAATMAANHATEADLKTLFSTIPGANEQLLSTMSKMLTSPWGQSFTSYQPAEILKQLNMPLLAINGDLDIQVNGQANLAGIQKIMTKSQNKDVTITLLPGLNHLFQKAKTGHVIEYAQINETINKVALDTLSQWLITRF
ncbi:lysophospholipase [Paraglaciecola aquimarina]|uniref:Lysophospholipase n=1 Tax=Paraglaciecola algarum TaxID=3050085 RepID=A0ABS9D827_9ALTE|nr:alpha/beta fold hydrolase [Paraglaciecola sp. G1-23]MCF2949085.1 lysophospholipase [Paraglaciecola sp. G1-23]